MITGNPFFPGTSPQVKSNLSPSHMHCQLNAIVRYYSVQVFGPQTLMSLGLNDSCEERVKMSKKKGKACNN